jgi:hypothetical protein
MIMSLQNFGPSNPIMLKKKSMDNKKTRYQQNYSLQNEIHAKNSGLYKRGP